MHIFKDGGSGVMICSVSVFSAKSNNIELNCKRVSLSVCPVSVLSRNTALHNQGKNCIGATWHCSMGTQITLADWIIRVEKYQLYRDEPANAVK